MGCTARDDSDGSNLMYRWQKASKIRDAPEVRVQHQTMKTPIVGISLLAGLSASAFASWPALQIELAGIPESDLKVVRTVLTGASADAIDEDGQPPAIKPVSSEVTLKKD
jgi:hypothetical protein